MIMNVLLIGPPGVGKGTQASYLIEKYNLIYITTGNLLRKQAKLPTDLGRQIARIIASGDLVSDDIVEALIKSELKNVHAGVLFDGYPRNISQVRTLENILDNSNRELDVVVSMTLEDSVLIKRISGRFVCASCSAVYNKYFVKTEVIGVCDYCHGNNFIIRADDSEEIIKKRLDVFHQENDAIINYYRNRGVLVDIDCHGGVNEISQKISTVIDCLKVKI
jgi:adenylate kinase